MLSRVMVRALLLAWMLETDIMLRIEALYASGIQGAQTFLEHWDFDQYKTLYRSGDPCQPAVK